jgi:hypothetical protein
LALAGVAAAAARAARAATVKCRLSIFASEPKPGPHDPSQPWLIHSEIDLRPEVWSQKFASLLGVNRATPAALLRQNDISFTPA